MSKGRFAAVFEQKKPAVVREREDHPPAEPKPRPERKPKLAPAPPRAQKTAARTKSGRQRIPTVKWADVESFVTIGAKVPDAVAQHWAIEAKRQRTSISYIISQALIKSFGLPEGAILPEEEGE